MRNAWLGFHIIMLLLVIAAFNGMFAPAPTGSFVNDSGTNANIIIGLFFIWIVGAFAFRIARRFAKY